MTWIYENGDWPNFRWDDTRLAPRLADTRHRQGKLLGRMQGLGFTLQQEASLNTLTTDVVKSSAIEGEQLNPEQVRSSLAQKLGIDVGGFTPTSRDVEGIVEIMIDATANYDKPLTAERLFNWHAALFPTGRSGLNRITVAAWRPKSAGPMQIVSGPMGRERVHYEAVPATDVDREMSSFLKWFEGVQNIDPVLKAGIVHYWFEAIHPFEDGNGRLGRALADMMLARADRSKDRYYSLSSQIEAERKDYYAQLERQSRGTMDLTQWLEWFLDCLGRALEAADETLSYVLYKAKLWDRIAQHKVNDRQRLVLNRMTDGFKGHMTTSKYAKIAKCSPDTALRDLKPLIDYEILIQNPGGGRSTSYRLINAEELSAAG